MPNPIDEYIATLKGQSKDMKQTVPAAPRIHVGMPDKQEHDVSGYIDLHQQECPGCGHFLIDVTATHDLQKDSHALAHAEEGDMSVCAQCLIADAQIEQPTVEPSDTELILWELHSGSGVKAFLKSDPSRCAHGNTIAEAVGDLVMSQSNTFAVQVQSATQPGKDPQS